VAYLARRFVARHRIGVGVAAGFAALLLASAVALAVEQAATARERDRAAAEAANSAQMTDYLMGLFEASDPGEALGDTITARELLERGVARADALRDQPTVQATLLGVTGRVYVNLGEYARGAALLGRSLDIQRAGPDPDEVRLVRTILDLASTLELEEEHERATELYREVVARSAGNPDARSLLLAAQFGIGSTLHARHEMAAADSAFALWEAMLDRLPPTPTPELADGQVWLGQMLQYRTEHARAERMLRRAVATNRAVYGEGHPEVGNALNALASALLSARTRVAAADSATAEALALQRALGPEPRRALINAMANRAELLEVREAYAEAEDMARSAQALAGTAFGEDHLVWGRVTARLAHVLSLRGKNAEAEALYRMLYAQAVDERGADYHFTVVMAIRLAEVLAAQGEFPEAERLLLTSHEAFRRDRGDDDVWTTTTAARIERMYLAWEKPEQAALYAGHGPPPPPGRE
jgi:tetratricopeptide (TPR) repeat protein